MDINTAQRLLPISKHRLDDELESHADIAFKVSDQLSLANTHQLRLKDELARVEARVYATNKDSGVKHTAEDLKNLVIRNSARIEAFEAYVNAREQFEAWLGMAEAWRQRSYMITKLGDLFTANYFTQTLTSLNDNKDQRPAWQQEGLSQRKAAEVTAAPARPRITRRTA